MENQPSSLSEQLAGLRDIARARPENRARILDPIHTLIMACLARIFSRLEQILALWQAGCLPAPAVRRAPIFRNGQPRFRPYVRRHRIARSAPPKPAQNLAQNLA